MSLEYAERRIIEALEAAKGNPTRARQQIIAWSHDDPKLLLALARPHLTGIVAHAVNRVIYRQNLQADDTVSENPQKLDMAPETFGQAILNSLQSNDTPRFGHEGSAAPVGRRKASKSHIEALKRMARRDTDDE